MICNDTFFHSFKRTIPLVSATCQKDQRKILTHINTYLFMKIRDFDLSYCKTKQFC